jgi:hypothetical protein
LADVGSRGPLKERSKGTMSDPAIKSRLESDFLTGQPAPVKARLDQCLAMDARHVPPGKRDPATVDGQAVTALQEALRRIRKDLLPSLPDNKDGPGDYGVGTRNAVRKYKSDPSHKIVRQGQALDDIIGRMTITQIDNDLVTLQGKAAPTPPTPPVAAKTQDVYIKIFGFNRGNDSQQGTDQSNSVQAVKFAADINGQPGYLDSHAPLQTVWFNGGFAATNPTDKIVKKIEPLKANTGVPLGKVMLSGGSSGGKSATEVANKLADKNVRVDFIALWDAAFQREDLVDPTQFDKPENFNLDSPATLHFKSVRGGRLKINFFQSWGHCHDKNQEIHGFVDGFVPQDMTNSPQVERVKQEFAQTIFKTGSAKQKALDDAHTAVFVVGRDLAEATVRTLLKPKP